MKNPRAKSLPERLSWKDAKEAELRSNEPGTCLFCGRSAWGEFFCFPPDYGDSCAARFGRRAAAQGLRLRATRQPGKKLLQHAERGLKDNERRKGDGSIYYGVYRQHFLKLRRVARGWLRGKGRK